MRSVLILFGFFALAAFLAYSAFSGVHSDSGKAAVLEAVVGGQPTPTVFPEPSPVAWTGHVTRTLAGGRGIEVRSVEAPGGWFFAYRSDDEVLGEFDTPIRVSGLWHGISCEYGRCSPEVEIESLQQLPISPE